MFTKSIERLSCLFMEADRKCDVILAQRFQVAPLVAKIPEELMAEWKTALRRYHQVSRLLQGARLMTGKDY